jgi:RimJ/RimL family protein N-acetyltransferase
MMQTQMQTERLSLRPLTPDDAEDFYDVFSDPEVLRYTPSGPPESVEQARRWLQERVDRGDNVPGVRTCAVVLREIEGGIDGHIDGRGGGVIGTAGIVPIEGHEGEYEVAYHLGRAHWGKGLATEAARAWLAFGFTTMKLSRIIGLTYEANVASRKVLTKVGMIERGETDKYFGITTLLHDITRERWEAMEAGR